MVEIIKRKEFDTVDVNGNEIKLVVKRPNQDVINEGDLIYNVEVSKAIRRGVMSKQEAASLSRERGLWTEKDEKQFGKLRKSIRDNEVKLSGKKVSKKVGANLAKEITKERTEISLLINKRDSLLNLTAENYASSIRDQYYVAMCVFDAETDESYFEDYEEYLERANEIAAIRAYQEVIYLINDLDPNFIKNQVENQYMIKSGMMNKEGYLVDTEGRKIDSEGRRINDRFEYVIDHEGEEIRCDEFGNPLDEDGEIDSDMIEKLRKVTEKENNVDGVKKEEVNSDNNKDGDDVGTF